MEIYDKKELILMQALLEVEADLPQLLEDESRWNTLDIDYHPPHVQRVWTEHNGYRVCLHRFPNSCNLNVALYHPHPWPSAIRIIEGGYVQSIGHETIIGNEEEYTIKVVTDAIVSMQSDDVYIMANPKAWHKVVPAIETYSLMLMGPLFDKDEMSEAISKPHKKLEQLSEDTKLFIIEKFKAYYGNGEV